MHCHLPDGTVGVDKDRRSVVLANWKPRNANIFWIHVKLPAICGEKDPQYIVPGPPCPHPACGSPSAPGRLKI